MPKIKLNCHDLYKRVQSMKKNEQDNGMTDHTCAVYVENKSEFSWPMR